MAHWEDDAAFIQWAKTHSAWAAGGSIPWWIKYTECGDENQTTYDKVTIVLAMEILKEGSGVLSNSEIEPYIEEGLGRQFWDNCRGSRCYMSSDWTASNAFLNFLSYSQSMRTGFKLIDVSTVFPSDPYFNTAIGAADGIRSKGWWISGLNPNRPYHFFNTDSTNSDWMLDWLEHRENDYLHGKGGFGMGSIRSNGIMQAVYIWGTHNSGFGVILTPNQKDDLCGYNQDCLGPKPEPDWYKKQIQ